MRFLAVALFFCGVTASYAQAPRVPQTMGFAGMTLTLNEDARQEIQKDVDLLTKYTRYFDMKVDRARAYFPIIEKVFEEEGIPDDFKFLVLQESALVSDAVSVSNAVGFWQFKDYTAMEMGMRVDKEVDERMNLVSSTRGAARYLKQNNYYFNNWLLALQSYQMGLGGVRRSVGESENGSKNMEITSDTYWYVKKFLAHKAAFENALAGEAKMKLISYEPTTRRTLKEIGEEVSVKEEDLKEYNKWLKASSIPADKTYSVLVPAGSAGQDFTKLILASNKPSTKAEDVKADVPRSINSIPVLVAVSGEQIAGLAKRGGISVSALLKNNEIAKDHPVQAGDIYFLSRKKTMAEQETYTVRAGDDVWTVSQQFGIKEKSIRKYNRMSVGSTLVPGSVLWLRASKPKDAPSDPPSENAVILEDDSFDWYIKSPKETETVTVPLQPAEKEVRVPAPVDVTTSAPVVVVPALSPITAGTADEQPKPSEHRVLAGQTLYSIAKQYNLQVTDLLTWNNLGIQDGLKPGQILKIVENEPLETIRTEAETPKPLLITHEVKASDTLYSVARQYGVTIKDIMDWNHKKDFSLSRGEKLEIRQNNR